jgi:hypothetical protein
MTPAEISLRNEIQSIADVWRTQRPERPTRRHQDQVDIDA